MNDVIYAFDARMYLFMCLFETDDSLGMERLVHSFRMLLERSDRVSEQYSNAYLSFVLMFRKLQGLPPYYATQVQRHRAEIELMGLSAGTVRILGFGERQSPLRLVVGAAMHLGGLVFK